MDVGDGLGKYGNIGLVGGLIHSGIFWIKYEVDEWLRNYGLER